MTSKPIRSMDEFYATYLPKSRLRHKEEAKLETIKVCPDCGCRILVWNEHETYGYLLCYGCGWSSMTPQEIGRAMAKEVSKKLKLDFALH